MKEVNGRVRGKGIAFRISVRKSKWEENQLSVLKEIAPGSQPRGKLNRLASKTGKLSKRRKLNSNFGKRKKTKGTNFKGS